MKGEVGVSRPLQFPGVQKYINIGGPPLKALMIVNLQIGEQTKKIAESGTDIVLADLHLVEVQDRTSANPLNY